MKKILIIEDDIEINTLLADFLRENGYAVHCQYDGLHVLDFLRKEKIDLIILDIMLPYRSGDIILADIRKQFTMPVIIISAKETTQNKIDLLRLGADDYILKPFTPSILKAKVRNLINGRVNLKQMYTKLLVLPEHGNSETDEGTEEVKMEDPFIASLVKIIEENIREADFNVKRLASDMNMSQPTLYRKVKQSTDFTIIELIRGVRMKKAAGLLKQKVYAVQEVAEMVGYNDIPTFRKHFVDTFGSTPSTYANSTDNS